MACATVIEEMLPLLPAGMQHQIFGLHINPDRLRHTLQEAVDAVSGQYDTIILGYGLCSQAIIGVKSNGCRLVAPRANDCIAIFLGSRAAYSTQCRVEPGTYYLIKGWIEVGDTPFSEYECSVQRYGKERANRIFRLMMGNYTRVDGNEGVNPVSSTAWFCGVGERVSGIGYQVSAWDVTRAAMGHGGATGRFRVGR
jgi:hypothetical protein